MLITSTRQHKNKDGAVRIQVEDWGHAELLNVKVSQRCVSARKKLSLRNVFRYLGESWNFMHFTIFVMIPVI